MPIILDGTQGITFPDNSRQYNGYFGFKNRIINGDMRIDQRNAGASVATSTATTVVYTIDRFAYYVTATAKFTVQQNAGSVTPPAGFTNYLGMTSTSAYSVTSTDEFGILQPIEGFNVYDLGWGTSNAQTVTLSFWVRSSLTGTFGGTLRNGSAARSYPFSFVINAANTWEQKTITVPGDTSGTWATNNGVGVYLTFSMGAGATKSGTAGSWQTANLISATGAVNMVGTNGATFYITGVQLEEGVVSTNFDVIPYTTQLQLCQRYYFKITGTAGARLALGQNNLTTQAVVTTTFQVTMRAAPSALEQSGTAGDYEVQHGNVATACSAVPFFASASQYLATSAFTVASGLTAGQGSAGRTTNTNGYLAWSAEL